MKKKSIPHDKYGCDGACRYCNGVGCEQCCLGHCATCGFVKHLWFRRRRRGVAWGPSQCLHCGNTKTPRKVGHVASLNSAKLERDR